MILPTVRRNALPIVYGGFGLNELMGVLSIAAIMVFVGAPIIADFVQDSRLRVSANALQNSFAQARSAAVARSARVTVCISSDGQNCTTGNWADGWVIFEDENALGEIDETNDTRIKVQQALQGTVTVLPSTEMSDAVFFDFLGFVRNTSDDGDYLSGSFLVCDDRGDAANTRAVYLSAAGSSRVGGPENAMSCDSE